MKKTNKNPVLHPSAFVHESAQIIGDVILEEGSSLWPGAVIRGDYNRIHIGKNTNVQDLCLLHITENMPCLIGEGVTIGHGAILHACTVEDRCLIGMGSILLDGCRVGSHSWIGAGSLVPPGMIIPSKVLAMGSPAKIIRTLTEEEIEQQIRQNLAYVALAQNYRIEGEKHE